MCFALNDDDDNNNNNNNNNNNDNNDNNDNNNDNNNGACNKDLDKELNMLFGPKVARVTIERSQEWVTLQNCEIVKRFSSMQLCKSMNIAI